MRLRSWNAYESELTSGIDGSTGTIQVTSAAGLIAPVILVIDPEDQAVREFVMVTSVSTNTLTATRGLAGSAAGGVPHTAGAKIRAVPAHQWLDEIFDDIELVASDLAGHEGAADPHSQYLTEPEGDTRYVELTGDTMTGPGSLVLSADPTVPLGAATKQSSETYTDDEIVTHTALPSAHHTKYSDGEAVAALAANGPILLQVVKWGDSMTLTGQGDSNSITYDISSFGFAGVNNLIATVRHGAANQQSRESIMTIEGFNINQLTVHGYGAGVFPSGGAFFTVQIEEYDRDVLVTAPPVIP